MNTDFAYAPSTCPPAASSPPTIRPDLYPHIRHLAHQLASPAQFQAALQDLPQQFERPQPRPWPLIPWDAIAPDQLVGIAPATACRILAGSINTEAPIHAYTQASRQYLAPLHPAMAAVVGGQAGRRGLWELEEKRHTPALLALYRRLGGTPLTVQPHAARPHIPSPHPQADLFRHGLHRIVTEYGAACLYLWLLAHSHGPLAAVLTELVHDEVNHLAKFWGFGRWAYPHTGAIAVVGSLGKNLVQRQAQQSSQNPSQLQRGSLMHTLGRMTTELAWADWSGPNRRSFGYTLAVVMGHLLRWDRQLTPMALHPLLGPSPTSADWAESGGDGSQGVPTVPN